MPTCSGALNPDSCRRLQSAHLLYKLTRVRARTEDRSGKSDEHKGSFFFFFFFSAAAARTTTLSANATRKHDDDRAEAARIISSSAATYHEKKKKKHFQRNNNIIILIIISDFPSVVRRDGILCDANRGYLITAVAVSQEECVNV